MTLNGKNVSDSFLDPGFSTIPSWRMLYRAFDVTSLVRPGANAVGVRLGQGKYSHGWYTQSHYMPTSIGTCSKIYTVIAAIEHVPTKAGT